MALPAAKRATSASQADRRLAVGLVVSLLLHAALLLLQFGVIDLGRTGAAPPLTVRIAAAPLPPEPSPPLQSPVPDTVAPPLPPAPVSGMRLVNPVVEAAPAPAPPPKAKPVVKKDKPRKARRISPPIPAPSTVVEPSRVITQDSTRNDFVVPLARPEEAEQKTVDINQSQHGEEEGDADTSAAAEAAAAKAGLAKAAEEVEARRVADEERLAAIEAAKRAAEQDKLQRQLALAEQVRADDERKKNEQLAQQQKADQQAQQQGEQRRAEQLRIEQQRAEQQLEQIKQDQQKAEQQQREQQKLQQQKLEQQKIEQQKLEQQKLEQQKLEQQKLEQQKLEQQKLEQQKLEQQKIEQQKREQQRLEREKAEQQRIEQQRIEQQKEEQQKAEQQKAEQQRAEQIRAEQQKADRERAEQAARQAAQQAAQQAGQPRGTAPAATPSTGLGNEGRGPGAGGTGGAQIPRNMLGSDAGNRARDLIKGIDVLRGDPPRTPPRMRDNRRVAVGASERDLSLRMYVESWRQKIERNGGINYPRSWADEVRIDPLVSVAVRSDGSVEDVTIITSSGRADMDEAVRRIVRVNARYSPFPPAISQRYDVIEIRRIWRFDDNLKLLEEVR
jgi:TonB family protein